MLPTPTVSVLITVLNGENFLSQAIESIFQQSFPDFELIVVDDGSSDATQAELQAIRDPRLQIICNQNNLGIPAARNIAIDAARGKYCAFLSHDDIALPPRLARQVEFLERNPVVGLIGSAVEIIDAKGESRGVVTMPESPIAIRWMGLLECPMRQSSLMGRSEMVRRHRYDTRFQSYSDWDFIMRVARETEVTNLAETLVKYRRHTTNTSEVHRARLDEAGVDIAWREIRAELPDFPITRSEVAELRHVLLGTRNRQGQKSIPITQRALDRYLDLSEAFRRKHPAHSSTVLPSVASLSL